MRIKHCYHFLGRKKLNRINISDIAACKFYKLIVLILFVFFAVSCATAPKSMKKEDEHLAAAKRFIHSMGAGEFAMIAMKQQMEMKSKDMPESFKEVIHHALAEIKAEDFEDMAAQVYKRHLSRDHLIVLSEFAESPTGSRFFKTAFASVLEGKQGKQGKGPMDIMSQFNADETAQIMKFAMSDAFTAMRNVQQTINREMAEEGRKFGEGIIKAYLNKK